MDVYGVTNATGQTLNKMDVDEILQNLGISADAIEEGTEDAIEQDADKNNIDLDQVAILAKQDGVSGSATTSKEDYETQLKMLGIPNDVIAKGNDAVQAYAIKNGIVLPQQSGVQLNLVS